MTTLTLNQVDLEQMVSWLMTRLKNSLPGKEAQLLMAPPLRENRMAPPTGFNPIESAVLIALVLNHNEPSIIFIKRPEYDGVHSGQMALPGGKKEKEDSNEWETAIRESYEEIGLPLDSAKQIGQISPLYIPHSGYMVRPVIAFLPFLPKLKADKNEVDSIHIIKIDDLLNARKRENITFNTINGKIEAPCFAVDQQKIWGATAMIISELLVILGEYLNLPPKTIFPDNNF